MHEVIADSAFCNQSYVSVFAKVWFKVPFNGGCVIFKLRTFGYGFEIFSTQRVEARLLQQQPFFGLLLLVVIPFQSCGLGFADIVCSHALAERLSIDAAIGLQIDGVGLGFEIQPLNHFY